MKNYFIRLSSKRFNSNKNENGVFNLKYKNTIIGLLEFKNDNWYFEYDKNYKCVGEPLVDFPCLEKKYVQESLWPFFEVRIPTLNQPFQIKKINKYNVNKNDQVGLLKLFGKKTIANPYELACI